ncbi:polyketide synthase-like protein [Whalleya microplaca]|nr:polyketide synthase-like protein [Whalleya microplaca]
MLESTCSPRFSMSVNSVDDPVCIVGLACHLPGDVRAPSSLWDLLVNKKCAQGPVPPERFNMQGFYCEDDSRAGVMSAEGGYFLKEDARLFENSFFGINNLEAAYMDPLQRKILEVVFECFESAGVTLDQMSSSNTGVYTSDFTTDYQTMHFRDPDYLHRYSSTGSGKAILANRISHVFNLQGPSLTLNTACSSSMYCLHTAVSALKNGDCDSAIVAAANLIMAPEQHLETMKSGVLSATSTCHTFDVSADGYRRAEGINAVYVKRLSSALKDSDKIWGVIRATALNANGKTPGISQPSAALQEAVTRKAYAVAGLSFADTDYIECHGTGTAIGDVIEVDALKRCFLPRGSPPLMIGSVKTNLGHSEANSGLTSLIKVLLAFENGRIPPTCGVTKLNPKLQLESTGIKVVTEIEQWPRSLRRASINSFGYGGANSHVILESLDSYLGTKPIGFELIPELGDQLFVLPISAASSRSLQTRVNHISTLAESYNATLLRRLAFTLTKKRSHLSSKASLLVKATADGGSEVIQTRLPETIKVKSLNPLPFAFVFTGQGAQYACMEEELLEHNDNFNTTIQVLDSVLQSLPPEHVPTWTLRQAILDPPGASKISEVTRSQPLCTAIQIGLVNILKRWDVCASAVVGHSSGEIAAAYAAGILSQSEAIIVAYMRGYSVAHLRAQGAMLAAGIDAQSAEYLIEHNGLEGDVCVACINAPESVTFSGSLRGIEILSLELERQKKFCRKLETDGQAYHSHMMKEIGSYYEALTAPFIDVKRPDARTLTAHMYSSVGYSGTDLEVLTGNTNMARYWRKNLEAPVQFDAALRNLVASRGFHLVEIGPHHTLKAPIQQILRGGSNKQSLPYSPSLVRGEDSTLAIKKLAGSLFLYGHALNWTKINNLPNDATLQLLHNIPPYPWDYSGGLLWTEPRASIELRNRQYVRHELLGSQQLAGNGVDWNWRNILLLSEVPWIRDHKVESLVIFPASGYVAMAIEAVSQIRGLRVRLSQSSSISFELRNVSISAAFVVTEVEAGARDVELLTTVSPRKLSVTTASANWYDFSISSWVAGQATIHCAGSIRIRENIVPKTAILISNLVDYETWSMERWYEKFEKEGLCYGPQFRSLMSLSTEGNKTRTDAMSTVQLQPQVAQDSSMKYIAHPITIDACLQTAILSSTGGNLDLLRAYLPVFISGCWIQGTGSQSASEHAQIQARAMRTGVSTQRSDCTLRRVDDTVILNLKGVRLSLYTGKMGSGSHHDSKILEPQRNPCLRVYWKPDIFRLYTGAESQLIEFIKDFIQRQHQDLADDTALATIGALVDLAGHKNPEMKVLELGRSCDCKAKKWLDLLNMNTTFPRCRTWNAGELLDNGDVSIEGEEQGPFDVVIIPSVTSTRCWKVGPKQLLSQVRDHGIIISRKTDEALHNLGASDFTVMHSGRDIILAVRNAKKSLLLAGRSVLIVFRELSPYVDELISSLQPSLQQVAGVTQVRSVPLSEIHTAGVCDKTICISLLEAETEFLATMNQDHMDLLRGMTDIVTDLLWITGANMLDSSGQADPNLTLASGLSRALMLEQPSLRFSIVDIGPASDFKKNALPTCENLIRALIPCHDTDDKEFIYSKGLLYISRFGPDPAYNALFRRRLGMEERLRKSSLESVDVARLAIDKIGRTDTIYFQKLREPSTKPTDGFVDIIVKAIGLNAKDVYTIGGHLGTRMGTTACEFSGVIKAVAEDVTHIQPGDRVVTMFPNHFTTVERVPAWAVFKLLPEEEFTTIVTIPVAYSTALYALHDRAHLRRGESVLIHAGSGALGIAVVAIAQSIGAIVYATVGSEVKKNFLITEFGLPASHIFSSRDASFVDGVLAMTGGRGVDVVINSLVGDLMHASWDSCVANFGRFVEVGKRELTEAGRLDMCGVSRNATFTAFDMEALIFSEDKFYQELVASKVREALSWYRSRRVRLPPVTTFDVANISQAYRYFSAEDRVGKVVISLENPESLIQASEPKYFTLLDPEKTYLLVGCLGGLGRILSRWMMARGARSFVFLGRSGCDKPDAQKLVSNLQNSGAYVTVIKGDVTVSADVIRAIKACEATEKRIGGVIQAAMGLREAIFSQMSSESWHIGVDCKWVGTWNLHTALEGHDESFFLMTSSNSGSVGVATEANYCASNGFLDAFARWRRSQGRPATSVGLGMISEVGYLHENPDIEAILIRRGIQAMPEDEFLQLIDLALSGDDSNQSPQATESSTAAHILTGLESVGFRKLLAQGFDVNNLPMQDPRSSLLAESLAAEQRAMEAAQEGPSQVGQFSGAAAKAALDSAPWALMETTGAASMREAILQLVRKQFSNLILIPPEQIDNLKPLALFGVDSMLAAEFRTWFWATFKVDIPFLDLLSTQKSLESFVDIVEAKISESPDNGDLSK